MTMDVRALPSELLDEKELEERYRAIDAAVSRVRRDFEANSAKVVHKAMKVRLAAERTLRTG